MLPFTTGFLGVTLPDFARQQLSETPSKTRSLTAFLPGRISVLPRSYGQFPSQQHGSGRWYSSPNQIVGQAGSPTLVKVSSSTKARGSPEKAPDS